MRSFCILWITIVCFIGTTKPVGAGPFTDALAHCFVQSVSPDERNALVQWMFVASALHPAVQDMVSLSEDQIQATNQKTAELFMGLLTGPCLEETHNALNNEGTVAITGSFTTLGYLAARELYANPQVVVSLSNLAQYIDFEKLEASATAE